MADSTSANNGGQSSGSKNPGGPPGAKEEFEDLFERTGRDSGSSIKVFIPQTDTTADDSAVGYSHHMFDAIEQHQQLQKQEESLKRVEKRLIDQEDVQAGLLTKVSTVTENMSNLDNDINSLEKEVHEINSRIETLATEDDAYSIADEKINGRVVRPLFLLISLLTLVGAGSALLTGPIVVGIVLATVTAVAWYLLYVTRP
jgi:hypothetical protein